MLFTVLGLVSAMLFGVFFGSDGDLPKQTQEWLFFSLIIAGAALHGLQIVYEKLCRSCRCWVCQFS